MALTKLQKTTAQAIVQIFETGSVEGEYGQVTLISGDSGHLTYGKAQTTLASGNLYFLIRDYTEEPTATHGADLLPFLQQLEDQDISLDNDQAFKDLLRVAGDDPVMHKVQDSFFDRIYWEPTLASADYIGATSPLSIAIIYDSRIHGSWHARRDEVILDKGALTSFGEKKWMTAYVKHRRAWLAHHGNSVLHATVYRMDAFQKLISRGRWNLKLPIDVRSHTVTKDKLTKPEPVSPRALDGAIDHRLLRLTDPQLVGEDVREVQLALVAANLSLTVDGVFGPGTDAAVRSFQQKMGLVSDGVVGDMTRENLGLET